MTKQMTVSDQLNIAADLIQVNGWGQGASSWMLPEDGSSVPLCLEGAIIAATGLSGEGAHHPIVAVGDCPAAMAVKGYLDKQMGDRRHLFQWNDQLGRTQEEVIEVLRATALVEHAKEHAASKVEVSA